ncbi:MAG: hypothetical protein IKS11_09900, partial [Lachnospiraceae bacterium]|nr:hypothetical protein [Lachnospiraceae bacterium]
GVHFTAANVTLIGELDAADLVSDGSLATRRYHAFSGIYIILETKEKAESEFLFCFNDNIGGSKNPLKDGDLSKSYTITAEEPEFGKKFAARYEKFLRRLYAENDFTPHIYYRDNRLNIGIQTIATKFRAINGKPDINDPESFRADYRRSLEYVRNAIDAVREETDLLIADD